MNLIVAAVLALVAAPTITGTWQMGLEAGHVVPVALVLKQDGQTLTGTISLPTQNLNERIDVPLKGEMTGGAFTLSGSVENATEPTTINIDGGALDDGTLDGHIEVSGHHGRMHFTAERLKERKPQ